MNGNPISVAGIEIPSDTPYFLALISVHILAALVCVVAGIIAMLAKKQPGRHPKAGNTYFYSLIVVFLTVILIAILRWQEDLHLFILGFLSFSLAFAGRLAEKKRWNKWPYYHVSCMGLSYIILVTAFYVDNGRFLPLWKDLPTIVYWTLPGFIGIPIILITLKRHPVIAAYDKTQSR
jgi:hypothetical protein